MPFDQLVLVKREKATRLKAPIPLTWRQIDLCMDRHTITSRGQSGACFVVSRPVSSTVTNERGRPVLPRRLRLGVSGSVPVNQLLHLLDYSGVLRNEATHLVNFVLCKVHDGSCRTFDPFRRIGLRFGLPFFPRCCQCLFCFLHLTGVFSFAILPSNTFAPFRCICIRLDIFFPRLCCQCPFCFLHLTGVLCFAILHSCTFDPFRCIGLQFGISVLLPPAVLSFATLRHICKHVDKLYPMRPASTRLGLSCVRPWRHLCGVNLKTGTLSCTASKLWTFFEIQRAWNKSGNQIKNNNKEKLIYWLLHNYDTYLQCFRREMHCCHT